MGEYVVIKKFTDKDDKHKYAVGDRYPYRGFSKKERLEELSTKNNARGEILIVLKKSEKVEKPKYEETEKKTSEVKEEKPKRSSSKK